MCTAIHVYRNDVLGGLGHLVCTAIHGHRNDDYRRSRVSVCVMAIESWFYAFSSSRVCMCMAIG